MCHSENEADSIGRGSLTHVFWGEPLLFHFVLGWVSVQLSFYYPLGPLLIPGPDNIRLRKLGCLGIHFSAAY